MFKVLKKIQTFRKKALTLTDLTLLHSDGSCLTEDQNSKHTNTEKLQLKIFLTKHRVENTGYFHY